MKIDINLAQLNVLDACARGEVYRDEQTMRWWMNGHAVTASADVLVRKDYLRPAQAVVDNRRQGVITTRGQAVRDELASREPAPGVLPPGVFAPATTPEWTAAQLRVLKAATAGRVSQADGAATWREYPERGRAGTRRGRAVTQLVERLIARGVARKSTDLDDDNRRPLVVTADGYELLSRSAHDR